MLAIIFAFYGFKSTAKDVTPIVQTKLNYPLDGLKSEEVLLKGASFNPKNNIIWVQFHSQYLSNAVPVKELTFISYCKDNQKELRTDTIFHEGNDYIVQIKNSDKKYFQINIKIKEKYIGTNKLSDTNHIMVTLDYRKMKKSNMIEEHPPTKPKIKKDDQVSDPTILEQINEKNGILADLNDQLDSAYTEQNILNERKNSLEKYPKSQREKIKEAVEKGIDENNKAINKINSQIEKTKKQIINLNLQSRNDMKKFMENGGEKNARY